MTHLRHAYRCVLKVYILREISKLVKLKRKLNKRSRTVFYPCYILVLLDLQEVTNMSKAVILLNNNEKSTV